MGGTIPNSGGATAESRGRTLTIKGNKQSNVVGLPVSRNPRGTHYQVNLGNNPKGQRDAAYFDRPATQARQDAQGNLNLRFPGNQQAKLAKGTDNAFTPTQSYKYERGQDGKSGQWKSAPNYNTSPSQLLTNSPRLMSKKSKPVPFEDSQ